MPVRPRSHRPARAPQRDSRPTTAARGYGAAWRRTRAAYLALHPLCADCLSAGQLTPATQVHHQDRISHRPDLTHEETNLRSLCASCHSRRTRRGE